MNDFLLALGAGLLTGIFAAPIIKNLSLPIPVAVFILPPAFAILFSAGVVVARWLGRWIPWLFQFSKFVATGFLNAAVDFGILNLLIFWTGVAGGIGYIVFKSASFIVANINSYIWNLAWVFSRPASEALGRSQTGEAAKTKEYAQFLTVSIVGFLLNVGAAAFVVGLIGPRFGMGVNAWANVGAAAGSAAGLLWNFAGYKFVVFRA